MATTTHVVTCFLRNDAEVLLLKRSEAVGSYRGLWGGVAGHAEGDPDAAARTEIREEAGIDPGTLSVVRSGEPFDVTDGEDTDRWRVHPYLFDCPTRTVRTDRDTDCRTCSRSDRPTADDRSGNDLGQSVESVAHEWVPPTEILRRETVPELWTSYDRVRPQVETIAADTDHGAAYLSVRALEVLRDAAALAAEDRGGVEDWTDLAALAREIRAARPAMRVLSNRVDRAMWTADQTPVGVEDAAIRGIDRALDAVREAAERAAGRIGNRIATLSRSGTVRRTLERADPAAVLVGESRPGREGVAVAEALAGTATVTLTTDAALAYELAARDVDTLVVGADGILGDGRVRNKVGTRGAALAASHEGIDAVVVASRDKISPDPDPGQDTRAGLEPREPAEVYDGPAAVSVANPTFDLTPARTVTVITENGVLDPAEIRAVAREHRRHAGWMDVES